MITANNGNSLILLILALSSIAMAMGRVDRMRSRALQQSQVSLGKPSGVPATALCAYILSQDPLSAACSESAINSFLQTAGPIAALVSPKWSVPASKETNLNKCGVIEKFIKHSTTITQADRDAAKAGNVPQFCSTECASFAHVMNSAASLSLDSWAEHFLYATSAFSFDQIRMDLNRVVSSAVPSILGLNVHSPIVTAETGTATISVLQALGTSKNFIGKNVPHPLIKDATIRIKKEAGLVGLFGAGAVASPMTVQVFESFFNYEQQGSCPFRGFNAKLSAGSVPQDRIYSYEFTTNAKTITVDSHAYTFQVPTESAQPFNGIKYADIPICSMDQGVCSEESGLATVPFKGYSVGTSTRSICRGNWLLNAHTTSLLASDVSASTAANSISGFTLLRSSKIHTPFVARQFYKLLALSVAERHKTELPEKVRVVSLSLVGMGTVESMKARLTGGENEGIIVAEQHAALEQAITAMKSEASVDPVVAKMDVVHGNLISNAGVYKSGGTALSAENAFNEPLHTKICEWAVELGFFGAEFQCSVEALKKFSISASTEDLTNRVQKYFRTYLHIAYTSAGHTGNTWRSFQLLLLAAVLREMRVNVGINCKSGLDRTGFVFAVFSSVHIQYEAHSDKLDTLASAYLSFQESLSTLHAFETYDAFSQGLQKMSAEVATTPASMYPLLIAEFQNANLVNLMSIGYPIIIGSTSLMGFKWGGSLPNPNAPPFLPFWVTIGETILRTHTSIHAFATTFANFIYGASKFRGA